VNKTQSWGSGANGVKGHRPIVCSGIAAPNGFRETHRTPSWSDCDMLNRLVAALCKDGDIARVMFTTTVILNAEVSRRWQPRSLAGTRSRDVRSRDGGAWALTSVVRVLIHWKTTLGNHEIQHMYLRGASTAPGPQYKFKAVNLHNEQLLRRQIGADCDNAGWCKTSKNIGVIARTQRNGTRAHFSEARKKDSIGVVGDDRVVVAGEH